MQHARTHMCTRARTHTHTHTVAADLDSPGGISVGNISVVNYRFQFLDKCCSMMSSVVRSSDRILDSCYSKYSHKMAARADLCFPPPLDTVKHPGRTYRC